MVKLWVKSATGSSCPSEERNHSDTFATPGLNASDNLGNLESADGTPALALGRPPSSSNRVHVIRTDDANTVTFCNPATLGHVEVVACGLQIGSSPSMPAF